MYLILYYGFGDCHSSLASSFSPDFPSSAIWKPSILRETSSAVTFTFPDDPFAGTASGSSVVNGPVCHILIVPSSDPEAYDSPPGEKRTQWTGPWWPLLHAALGLKEEDILLENKVTNLDIYNKKVFLLREHTDLVTRVEIKYTDPHIFSASNELVPIFWFQWSGFHSAWHVVALHQPKTRNKKSTL